MDLKTKIFAALSSYTIGEAYLEQIIDACDTEQSNHRTTITALSESEAELKEVKAELQKAKEHAQYLATELAGMDIALCKETEQVEKLKDILSEAFRKAL